LNKSLAVVYKFLALTNAFAPAIVFILGPTISVFIGGLTYLFALQFNQRGQLAVFAIFQFVRSFVLFTDDLLILFGLHFTWNRRSYTMGGRRHVSRTSV
jgi:hypothetical protein